MLRATAEAIRKRWGEESHIVSEKFNRILIEDSSQAKTDKSNADEFAAHGNGEGRTAGCKIDLAFDLLTGEPVSHGLYLASEQDREIGRELESLLRAPKARRIDCEVFIGGGAHPVRFVAIRTAPEGAREQRRKRRQKARELGKQPDKDMLLRDGWHILITNVAEEQLTSSEISRLYSARWQIEIVFRAWKQSGPLVQALARRSNPVHLQCLMLAAVLLLDLTLKVASLMRQSPRKHHLSIEKITPGLSAPLPAIPDGHRARQSRSPTSRHGPQNP